MKRKEYKQLQDYVSHHKNGPCEGGWEWVIAWLDQHKPGGVYEGLTWLSDRGICCECQVTQTEWGAWPRNPDAGAPPGMSCAARRRADRMAELVDKANSYDALARALGVVLAVKVPADADMPF